MQALITGGNSGIGFEISKALSKRGYDIIIVSRTAQELNFKFDTKTELITGDLSSVIECRELYNILKNREINVLVNNAGFGLFGEFDKTDLETELKMIDLNIKALHILTKLFLRDFQKRNSGYILNVASFAGLMPGGPMLSTYYATKSYVVSLTNGIYEELKKANSNVHISALCPGPVKTNFDNVAGVKFSVKGLESSYVAEYALEKLFNNKRIIVPGTMMNLAYKFHKLLSEERLLKYCYNFQHKKG